MHDHQIYDVFGPPHSTPQAAAVLFWTADAMFHLYITLCRPISPLPPPKKICPFPCRDLVRPTTVHRLTWPFFQNSCLLPMDRTNLELDWLEQAAYFTERCELRRIVTNTAV